MVSSRVPLLFLCVALTAHVVNACTQLKKGHLVDINKTFNGELAANQRFVNVNVATYGQTHHSGLGVSGLQVTVCTPSIPSSVVVSFSARHSEVRVRRLAHTDFSVPLQFRIMAHYSKSVFLDDGVVGATDGVNIL